MWWRRFNKIRRCCYFNLTVPNSAESQLVTRVNLADGSRFGNQDTEAEVNTGVIELFRRPQIQLSSELRCCQISERGYRGMPGGQRTVSPLGRLKE